MSNQYSKHPLSPVSPPGDCAGRNFWEGCLRYHCDCYYEAGCPFYSQITMEDFMLLPTKASLGGNIVYNDSINQLFIGSHALDKAWEGYDSSHLKAQHLYQTSNLPINQKDWYMEVEKGQQEVSQCLGGAGYLARYPNDFKKVVASTDPSLNLPPIPEETIQDFIQWYNSK